MSNHYSGAERTATQQKPGRSLINPPNRSLSSRCAWLPVGRRQHSSERRQTGDFDWPDRPDIRTDLASDDIEISRPVHEDGHDPILSHNLIFQTASSNFTMGKLSLIMSHLTHLTENELARPGRCWPIHHHPPATELRLRCIEDHPPGPPPPSQAQGGRGDGSAAAAQQQTHGKEQSAPGWHHSQDCDTRLSAFASLQPWPARGLSAGLANQLGLSAAWWAAVGLFPGFCRRE
jgi:hypothetical protein